MNTQLGVAMGVMLGALMFSGCVTKTWESYATPHYGRERAEQICHPYGHCAQAVWIAGDLVVEDPDKAYAKCERQSLEPDDEWAKNTVSLGLEINQCMVVQGYTLVPQ